VTEKKKQALIVYNPHSGNGTIRKKIPEIKNRLSDMGFTCNIKTTDYPGHAKELVKSAPDESRGLLVVIGGDGTFNECMSGVMESQITPLIGYLPAGTSCDIAKSLGIPKNFSKALDIIEEDIRVSMDVGRSSQGYFTYVSALGNYVDVSYTTSSFLKKRLGYLAYIIKGVKEFFTIKRMRISVKLDGKRIKLCHYSLILVLNTRQVAGFKVVSLPELDDGKMEVILFKYVPFINNLLFLLSFIFKIRNFPGIKHHRVRSVEFSTLTSNRWNLDGEGKKSGHQLIEVDSKALRIIINKQRKYLFINQGV
jgi:diacylglycerol kinase (ATP)